MLDAKLSRRRLFRRAGAAGALSLAAPAVLRGQGAARVVIVGGGAGGASLARDLKKNAPTLDITLIEAKRRYSSCFYSNLVIGGLRRFASITHRYDRLRDAYGVHVVHARAEGVDATARRVTLQGGATVDYDKLVLAPGIDFRFEAIQGYDAAAGEAMPHAYRGGAQTVRLQRQIAAMPAGGTVIVSAPPNPYRCPPGPYERASMIAHYCRQNKPRAKILILDAKDQHAKQTLFTEAWQRHYPGMIEWVPGTFGGAVTAVEAQALSVRNADGETFTGDVVNVIPPQRAGAIAHAAGAVDASGWCPIDPATMASTQVNDVHVIGDACIPGDMPKSAFAANSQAKVCAMALRHALLGTELYPALFRNTCWSRLAPEDTVKVGANYSAQTGRIVRSSGFVSAVGEPAALRADVTAESDGWYAGITADMFG